MFSFKKLDRIEKEKENVSFLQVFFSRAIKFILKASKNLKFVLGMILLSELSRRRIRSINKLVRVGRDECAVVVRVDKESGSLSFFPKTDSVSCFGTCNKCRFHSILNQM